MEVKSNIYSRIQKYISNITIKFNAPYSPMINPIEYFINTVKFNVKKNMPVDSENLLKILLLYLDSLTIKDIERYVYHIFKLSENINNLVNL